MKKVKCGNDKCSHRRPYHESEEDARPHALLEVKDDHEGKMFCSITCACIAGYYSVTKGWLLDPKTGQKLESGTDRDNALNAEDYL